MHREGKKGVHTGKMQSAGGVVLGTAMVATRR